ncbi:START domain [Macleaya cordata]|uniref:START domain n=1 Tax=Macleaya cordata TaxID=56857 RepID=A0A200R9C7_MACCD|nr:START domain [Macleaya cordata]
MISILLISSLRDMSNLAGILAGSVEFWPENFHGGWATALVLGFILLWHSVRAFTDSRRRRSRSTQLLGFRKTSLSRATNPQTSTSEIVSEVDLRNLVNDLDEKCKENEKWDNVVDKRNNLVTYNAKCCKPKDGPLKYLSVTVFENCSTELLRDFYIDNEYRKQWDKMLVEHEQLQVDEINGTEMGRSIKKFPLLTPREYVLAWRVWEGKEKTFYCFIKECEHALAPRQKKYVRVAFFRSGWRIKKVPGRNACEIRMVHQEDAGLNVEMAKLAFAKGIWNYVCKMDAALRKYSAISHSQSSSLKTALTLLQKVPPELDTITKTTRNSLQASSSISTVGRQATGEVTQKRKLLRKPSKKVVANGLLLLGGIVCLSRGHSALGAKLAIACILKKLTKHATPSGQAVPN